MRAALQKLSHRIPVSDIDENLNGVIHGVTYVTAERKHELGVE